MSTSASTIYAAPRTVASVTDCFFYHTMDIPGHGHAEGLFDLRAGVRPYLGMVNVANKRVLEVGTASGFLCFHMEREGAEVVAYDLSPDYAWDVVPFAGRPPDRPLEERKRRIQQINNAYWLCHRAYESRARVVYGTVYGIPELIGPVDIATFGCVLLHLRDPFLALQSALRLTRETVIVTELLPWWQRQITGSVVGPRTMERVERLWEGTLGRFSPPHQAFLPDYRRGLPNETWWVLGPRVLKAFLGVLGFEDTHVSYHWQRTSGKRQMLCTVVGRRTR